jgi:hypothetical protein
MKPPQELAQGRFRNNAVTSDVPRPLREETNLARLKMLNILRFYRDQPEPAGDPVEKIRNTKVLQIVLQGKTVYRK